jgi:hypothetical protein
VRIRQVLDVEKRRPASLRYAEISPHNFSLWEKRREGIFPCNIFLRFASLKTRLRYAMLRYAVKNTTQGSSSEAETPQGFALRYDAALREGRRITEDRGRKTDDRGRIYWMVDSAGTGKTLREF